MTPRPAAPESETPLVKLLRLHAHNSTVAARPFPPPPHCELVLEAATALSLAQTEIKGHMRVKDDLQARIAGLEKELAEYRKPPRMVVQCERHKGTPIMIKTFAQTAFGSYCPQCEEETLKDRA